MNLVGSVSHIVVSHVQVKVSESSKAAADIVGGMILLRSWKAELVEAAAAAIWAHLSSLPNVPDAEEAFSRTCSVVALYCGTVVVLSGGESSAHRSASLQRCRPKPCAASGRRACPRR